MNPDLWPMGTRVKYVTPHKTVDGVFVRSEEIEVTYIGACRGKQNKHTIEFMHDGKRLSRNVASYALVPLARATSNGTDRT